MNGFGLIAAIVQSIASLAWPAALVAIVWLFRGRLEDLLPKLQARYKDLEISFRLEQAEKEAAALPPPPAPANPDLERTPEETSRFEQIADISPRAAIMELRWELEEHLKSVAIEHNLTSPTYSLPMSLASITSHVCCATGTSSTLRVVGNTAAHGSDGTQFSKEDVLRYRNLADEVIRRLATMKLIAEPNPTSL
jgi:hypothetical protein